ncbi:MAG: DUF302 domain-containing protein [Gammaproteobacteria bacterium]|nr:MAG: DUF302 domain-containing protein [Gammaproteobacteria bacterium]
MKHLIQAVLALLLLQPVLATAQSDTVFTLTANEPIDQAYPAVYKALEDAGFYVVFEADIGRNLARFANRWGKDYNRNGLSAIRSMVFCNGWYANRVGNADPHMLALCPLHMTLIEKDGRSTALFARPTAIARTGKAREVAQEIEKEVVTAIRRGMAVRQEE